MRESFLVFQSLQSASNVRPMCCNDVQGSSLLLMSCVKHYPLIAPSFFFSTDCQLFPREKKKKKKYPYKQRQKDVQFRRRYRPGRGYRDGEGCPGHARDR